MTCGEIREYLFAFLDNEVETGLSMEIQRHLERCPDCAREVEIERAIRRHLARSLEGGMREPALDPQMLQRDLCEISGAKKKRSTLRKLFSRRRALVMAACSAALVLAAGWWWTIQSGNLPSSRHGVAEVLIEDFRHFLSQGRPLQMASADPEAVAAWLREQTGLELSLPEMTSGHCKLIGARQCRIQNRAAAFALYEMDGQPASLIILSGDLGLGAMQRVEHDGRTHWRDRCQGHTVVACRRGELIYAAVSTLPEEQLLHLMSGARHEQDAGS